MYPEYLTIQEKKYKIDTDYRTALACFRAINDNEIDDISRMIAVVCLLLGKEFPIDLIPEAIDKCADYLRCGKKINSNKKDMDYEQDKGRIMASFRSCYNMDITKENIHWWAFNDYIEGFTENEILSRVRNIRNINLNDIKDKKDRDEIEKIQEEYRLIEPKTKREKEIDEKWDKILGGE